MSGAVHQNIGAHFWDIGASVWSGAISTVGKLKSNSNAFHDTSVLVNEPLKGINSAAKLVTSLAKGAKFINVTQTLCDAHSLLSGDWRKATYFGIAQQVALLAAEILDTFIWLGELGFYSMADIANSLGGSASVFGKAFEIVTGAPLISGLVGIGFVAWGVDAGVKWWNSTNQAQTNYHFLQMLRCACQVGACGIMVYAGIAGLTLTAGAPLAVIALSLTCANLAFAILAYLYKEGQGNEALINEKNPALEKFKPRVAREVDDSLISRISGALDQLFSSPDGMDKEGKVMSPVCDLISRGITKLNEIGVNIPGGEAFKNLALVHKDFCGIVSGLNLFDRLKEWGEKDEDGIYAWEAWTQKQILSRLFLTAGHAVDFFKWLDTLQLLELGKLGATYSCFGVVLSPLMAKEACIIGAAGFAIAKANEEVDDKKKKIASASIRSVYWHNFFDPRRDKEGKWVDIETWKNFVAEKFSAAAVQKEKEDGPRAGRNPDKERLRWEKHALLIGTANVEESKLLFKQAIDGRKAAIAETKNKLRPFEKSWIRSLFHGHEIRHYRHQLKQDEALLKAYNWYDSNIKKGQSLAGESYPIAKGTIVNVKLPEGADEIQLEADNKMPLPVGTQVTVSLKDSDGKEYMHTITTTSLDFTVTLPKKMPSVKLTGDPAQPPVSIEAPYFNPEVNLNTSLFLQPGIKIKLPAGADNVKLAANSAAVLPAGTEITLLATDGDKKSLNKIVLPLDTTLTLRPGAEEVNLSGAHDAEPIEITVDSALSAQQEGSVERAYLFKCISKTYRWDQVYKVSTNMQPLVEKKAKITKAYEAGKIILCAGGIIGTAAAIANPAFLISMALVAAPTGFFGAWKFLYDREVKKKESEERDFKQVPVSAY